MSGAKINEVTNAEGVHEVERLAKEIWPEYYTSIIGELQVEYMLQHFQSVAAINAQIEEGYRYFLIKVDNENIGYFAILLYEKKKELFISKLYINLNNRGKGLGRQALGFIEALARSKGLEEVTLMVNKNNIPARQFYEQAGFINVAPIVKDIGSGFAMDDYLYSKKLYDLWARALENKKKKPVLYIDDPTKVIYLALAVTAIILFVITFFPNPKPATFTTDSIDIAKDPYQSSVVYADPISINLLGTSFLVKPVAVYKISGVLLGKYYSWPYSSWDRLSPHTLVVAWGDLTLPENLRFVSFTHNMRSHELILKQGALFDFKYLTKHASFNHIVAANTNISDAIMTLKTGQKMILEGYIVDVVNSSELSHTQWNTSRKRDDVGVGACEIVYVTRVIADAKVFE